MTTALLVIIYLAFISLGLPDSIFGAAWPQMHLDFSVPIGMQGVITIMTVVGTIISALVSSKAISRFGTGAVTAVSVLLTCLALVGISFSNSVIFVLIMTIPLGIGAGAVDTALNNYVAKNYKAKHMSWLHCFWGVGVTASPLILAFAISNFGSWRIGYQGIAVVQGILALVMFLSLGLWKKCFKKQPEADNSVELKPIQYVSNRVALKKKGVPYAVLAFFLYCSVEFTIGHWGASYLVTGFNLSVERGATIISLYYLGITIGRALSGFLAIKLKSKTLIRLGEGVLLIGIGCIFINKIELQMVGLLLVGFGLAPIFPCMIQLTPSRFGNEYSQTVIGLQMACAYASGFVISPLFGILGQIFGMRLLPIYIIILSVLLFFVTEKTDRVVVKECKTNNI